MLKVYMATRNSQGVQEVFLRLDGERILGADRFDWFPAGQLREISSGKDWRSHHLFVNREDALADYIAVEQARLRAAQKALREVA